MTELPFFLCFFGCIIDVDKYACTSNFFCYVLVVLVRNVPPRAQHLLVPRKESCVIKKAKQRFTHNKSKAV